MSWRSSASIPASSLDELRALDPDARREDAGFHAYQNPLLMFHFCIVVGLVILKCFVGAVRVRFDVINVAP